MSARVWLRRAYEAPTHNDGRRVLVDRMSPRGVAREDAEIDAWLREAAPSDALRRWFDHDTSRWAEFRRRYRSELGDHEEELDQLVEWTRRGRVTLVYGAKDRQHIPRSNRCRVVTPTHRSVRMQARGAPIAWPTSTISSLANCRVQTSR